MKTSECIDNEGVRDNPVGVLNVGGGNYNEKSWISDDTWV